VKQPLFLVPESQLLPKLAKRDEQAFQWLYDQYAHVLYGVILTIVGQPDRAASVVEDVFVDAWADFDAFLPRQGSLLTWLLNRARHAAHCSIEPQRDTSSAENSQDYTEVDNLMAHEHRILLYNMYFCGHTADQIAESAQLPPQGLRKLMQTTLQELKQVFSR
jgi:Sigma-70 region 2